MPINPTVPTTTPALEAERTLEFFAQKVQDAFDETKTLVNSSETAITAKVDKATANVVTAASSSALVTLAPTGTGPALDVENAGSKTLSISKTGLLAIGDQQTGVTFGSGAQVKSIGGINGLVKAVLAAFGNNANGYQIHFYKSRATTVEGRDSVASGDDLGKISFNGDAGASEEEGAYLLCEVDGAVSEAATITSIVRATNVVTITTAAAHGISAGSAIAVEGVTKAAFNGNFTVSTVPTTTTLTYAQVSGDDTDNTGIVARRNLPTRISIGTRLANDTVVTERVRINAAGEIGLGGVAAVGRNVAVSKKITGAASASGYHLTSTIESDVTTHFSGYNAFSTMADAVFTLDEWHAFNASASSFGTKATITNLYGFRTHTTLIGGVTNYGFRSALADNSAVKTLSAVARASNVVTATTSAGHGYAVGQQVAHAGITDATFNGTFTITEVPTTTTYKHAQTAADTSSSGGTSTPTAVGGGRWNFYAAGNAPNHFAGNVLVGITTPVANSSLLQTSNGVGFPATQVALSDPNTLDDYEEALFTPVLTFATPGDLVVAYTTQSGKCTKIGDVVFYTIRLTTSTFTHSTASGAAQLTGMPFTASSLAGQVAACTMRGYTKANFTQINSRLSPSTAISNLLASGSGQTQASLVAADMPTGGTVDLYITGHYYV